MSLLQRVDSPSLFLPEHDEEKFVFQNISFQSFVAKKVQYSSVHEAVKHGAVVEMQNMFQQGASLNEVDQKFKFTPLHWAAHHGALEVCFSSFFK